MMFISLVYSAFIFLFGLCIGSFLNCIVYRLELQENMSEDNSQKKSVSFLRGRSFCPHCKHNLSWLDLIPIFSFLFLKGKCRYCFKKISWQYPAVEIITGLIFLLIFSQIQRFDIFGFLFLNLFFLFYVVSSLIIIFVFDLKHYIIPDKVLFPLIGIVFLEQLIFKFRFLDFNHLWAGLGACTFFLFFFLISNGRWMGFGDVKLAFFMGLFLGYPYILVALFLAFLLGAIIGVGLIIFGSKNLKSEVPFGPFLIIGTFIALFYGQEIIQWYSYVFLF